MTGLDQYYSKSNWDGQKCGCDDGDNDFSAQTWLNKFPVYNKRETKWSALVKYFQCLSKESPNQKPIKVDTSPVKRTMQTLRKSISDDLFPQIRVHVDALWKEASADLLIRQSNSGQPANEMQTKG